MRQVGEGRWPPRDAFAILAVTLFLAGCTAVSPAEPTEPGRPTRLAATPQPLEPTPSTSPTSSPTGSSTASPTPSAAPFRTRARVADEKGDAGILAPPHADIVLCLIESNGETARVTVQVAANVSARLASGEVIGIGVDLFRNASARESDYQLFADGGASGWFAYLQTPDGFVEFPGAFRMGDSRLVFEVPLRSLGGLSATATATFLDWSQRGSGVPTSGNDRAPDTGRSAMDP